MSAADVADPTREASGINEKGNATGQFWPRGLWAAPNDPSPLSLPTLPLVAPSFASLPPSLPSPPLSLPPSLPSPPPSLPPLRRTKTSSLPPSATQNENRVVNRTGMRSAPLHLPSHTNSPAPPRAAARNSPRPHAQ
eukprot:3936-Chlamydomonas_euryale.AAC.2